MFRPCGMSILDYYSRKTGTLPNPKGSLLSSIPPRAIASANREVNKLVQSQSAQRPKRQRKANKNNVYSPDLRAQMGKAAAEIGATAAARKLSAKLGTSTDKRYVKFSYE